MSLSTVLAVREKNQGARIHVVEILRALNRQAYSQDGTDWEGPQGIGPPDGVIVVCPYLAS